MARDKKVLPDEGGQYALLRAIFQVSTAHRVNIIVINSPHNLKTTQIKYIHQLVLAILAAPWLIKFSKLLNSQATFWFYV